MNLSVLCEHMYCTCDFLLGIRVFFYAIQPYYSLSMPLILGIYPKVPICCRGLQARITIIYIHDISSPPPQVYELKVVPCKYWLVSIRLI